MSMLLRCDHSPPVPDNRAGKRACMASIALDSASDGRTGKPTLPIVFLNPSTEQGICMSCSAAATRFCLSESAPLMIEDAKNSAENAKPSESEDGRTPQEAKPDVQPEPPIRFLAASEMIRPGLRASWIVQPSLQLPLWAELVVSLWPFAFIVWRTATSVDMDILWGSWEFHAGAWILGTAAFFANRTIWRSTCMAYGHQIALKIAVGIGVLVFWWAIDFLVIFAAHMGR